MNVRAFEVWCSLFDFPPTVVNAASRGQAKYQHWTSIKDAWPDVPITSMRVRSAGSLISTDDFLRCAKRRGRPHVRCGDPVVVGDSAGVIVGHNSSANWDVLFHAGEYAGQRLNVHPDSCEYADLSERVKGASGKREDGR